MADTLVSQTADSPIQLYVNPTDEADAKVTSNLAVRWCVSPQLIADLKDAKVAEPHVLVVVKQGGTERSRYVANLLSEMTFVQFHHTGKHEILATIVAPHEAGFNLQRYFMGKLLTHSDQAQVLANYSTGEMLEGFGHKIDRFGKETQLDVVVPAEMFAKEPSKARMWLVGLLFETRGKDQCSLRKRTIAALVLSPFLAFAGFMTEVFLILCIGFLWLAGMYELPIKETLRNPWQWGPAHLVDDSKGSRWYEREDGTDTHPFWWVVNPLSLVVVICVIGGILFLINHNLISFVIVGGVLLACAVIFAFFRETITNWYEAIDDYFNGRKRKRHEDDLAEYYRDLEGLACNGMRPANFDSLPRARKTLRLRMQHSKNRVCKPYARQ